MASEPWEPQPVKKQQQAAVTNPADQSQYQDRRPRKPITQPDYEKPASPEGHHSITPDGQPGFKAGKTTPDRNKKHNPVMINTTNTAKRAAAKQPGHHDPYKTKGWDYNFPNAADKKRMGWPNAN